MLRCVNNKKKSTQRWILYMQSMSLFFSLTIEVESVHFLDLKSENSDRNENLWNPIFLYVCLSLSTKSSGKCK